MNSKTKPYWVKGGILAIPLYFVIAPVSFFLALSLGAGKDIIQYIAPELFFGAWGLAAAQSSSEAFLQIIFSLIVLVAILLGRIFILGAILGVIYEWFAKRDLRLLFVVLLAVVYAVGIGYLSYNTQDIWKVYGSVESPADCDDASKKLIADFNPQECYKNLAIKNQDVRQCDFIGDDEDYRAFCYEEVAHSKNDSSICGLISETTLNAHGVLTGRRDGCYSLFNLCEKVSAVTNRDDCWSHVARIQKDPSLCLKISDTHPAFTQERCRADIK